MADENQPPKPETPPLFTTPHADQDGKVEQAYVQRWLDENWKGKKECPICGTSKWNPGIQVASVIGGPVGRPLNATMTYPCVLVLCATCGYTFMINAIAMGIVVVTPPVAAPLPPDPTKK
jgi:hypothetical protein